MNADIRIYPDKEMKAVDMAVIVDSIQLTNGIVQGCDVSLNSGALHISDGRILIRGRLGVVEAGNIEIPSIITSADCRLLAVCDLAIDNPFYLSLFTDSEYDAIVDRKASITDFNGMNGVDFVEIGVAHVDASTGTISNWTPGDGAMATNSNRVLNNLQTAVSNLNVSLSALNSSVSTLRAHDSNQSIRAVSATLGNMAFDSTGAINRVVSVASVIPAGYSAIAAIPFASGSYAAYFYLCGMETATSVRVQLFRGEWQSVTQTNPSVVLICVRNL